MFYRNYWKIKLDCNGLVPGFPISGGLAGVRPREAKTYSKQVDTSSSAFAVQNKSQTLCWNLCNPSVYSY